MKALVRRNLRMKYGCPTLKGSKDIAQVKVLSTDNDNDAEGMALALGTIVPAS